MRGFGVTVGDIDGVHVSHPPGPVLSHSCARVGVRGGFLHVPQRNTGIQGL
jgi:hypothetical protein